MQDIYKQIAKSKVLVIGDSMLDTYYEGDAERISPEAPVPVIRVASTKYLLGGAANVARNISSLGGNAKLISLVGKDFAAKKIRELLIKSNIEISLIESQHRPSTVKSRIFARNQQVLRFDEELCLEIQKSEKKQVLAEIEQNLEENTTIILSDYGKGLIYKNLINDIYLLANAKKIEKPKILIDPKPNNKKFYSNAFILTPNTKETEELSGIKIKNNADVVRAGKSLISKLRAENLLITLGAKGMALFVGNEIIHIKSTAKQVYDVTGAGDTVIATIASCINVNCDLKTACKIATVAAGIVVEKVGSATASIKEIIEANDEINLSVEVWK